MTAITIREVPEPVLESLAAKAAQGGKSLQTYLLDLLTRDAATPTLAEMMRRLGRGTHAEVSTSDILAAIDQRRQGR